MNFFLYIFLQSIHQVDMLSNESTTFFPISRLYIPTVASHGILWCGLGLFTQIGRCVPAHTPPTILGNVGHNILKTKILRNI